MAAFITQDYPASLDKNPDVDVRLSAAKWLRDPERLARLGVDSEPRVRKAAYRNAYYPPFEVKGDTAGARRADFLEKHQRGEVWLDDYANSRVTELRTVVAAHTKDTEILESLLTDSKVTIRNAAIKNRDARKKKS